MIYSGSKSYARITNTERLPRLIEVQLESYQAAEMAMALFEAGQRACAERGLILVDTKYEFGKTPAGDIVVIDEIHTPDSSRFWFSSSYEQRFAAGEDPESFDKEYVRRFLAAAGFMGDGPIPPIPDDVRVEATMRYVTAVETITGEPFQASVGEEPVRRIRRNLGLDPISSP